MSLSRSSMDPSFVGYIGSTKDALLIIQAVMDNKLHSVPRRPHDKERNQLIQSGSVFVFVEERSGIKRWTDGVAWSPSRILGRFLVYRELDRNGLSSGKQSNDLKPLKKKRKSIEEEGDVLEKSSSNTIPDRSLVGSLIASYAFKEYGLIKKSMSLSIQRSDSSIFETIHLISYYRAEDVLSGRLLRPISSHELKDIQLSTELWNAVKETSLGGKIPIEDESFYFMDQSNPNAIALGFNPAIHLQPQYQQHNLQNNPSHNYNSLPVSVKHEPFNPLFQQNGPFQPHFIHHQDTEYEPNNYLKLNTNNEAVNSPIKSNSPILTPNILATMSNQYNLSSAIPRNNSNQIYGPELNQGTYSQFVPNSNMIASVQNNFNGAGFSFPNIYSNNFGFNNPNPKVLYDDGSMGFIGHFPSQFAAAPQN